MNGFKSLSMQNRLLLVRVKNAWIRIDVRSALQGFPVFEAYFQKKKVHIAQALQLECRATGRKIVVANVHLVMAGNAAQLRALQACLVLRRLHCWSNGCRDVLLCGDFNCHGWDPSAKSVLELVKTGV